MITALPLMPQVGLFSIIKWARFRLTKTAGHEDLLVRGAHVGLAGDEQLLEQLLPRPQPRVQRLRG
jgi:hypothetical protein